MTTALAPHVGRLIADTYADLNQHLFASLLVQPNIVVADVFQAKGHTGQPMAGWDPKTRTLALRADLLSFAGTKQLLPDLLVHEMVHQFCDESAGMGSHSGHEGAFRTIALNTSPRYGVAPPQLGEAEFWPMLGRPEGYYPGARLTR